jgi:Chaperone of endosialidase
MKNLKQILAIVIMAIASNAIQAQVKIGKNPTNITTNVNLEIEATNGVKSVFSKDLGNAGIGTTNTTTLGTQAFPTRLNVLGAGDNSFIAKFVGTGSGPIWNRVHIEGTNGSMIALNDVTANDGLDILNYQNNQNIIRSTSLGQIGFLNTFKSPTTIWESNNLLLGRTDGSILKPLSNAAVRIGYDAAEASLVTDGYVGIANLDPKNTLHVYGNAIIGYSDIVNTGGFSLVTGDGHNNSCNSSIITGTGNVTAGSNSIVAGQVNKTLAGSKNNIVTGDNQSVAGTNNVVTGGRHVVTGGSNLISGTTNTVAGSNSVVAGQGHTTLASSNGNIISGDNNSIAGVGNLISGGRNNVTNDNNTVAGYSNSVTGPQNLVSGSTNSVNATNGFAVGIQNTIVAGHNESVVMGNGVTTTATAQFRANFPGGIFFNEAPTITSDFRKKKNVNTLSYGIAEVMKMRPTSYQYKDNTTNDTNLGFIAQEMVKIVPEVVAVPKNDKDFYAIRYEELIPVLTKAIQEQQAEINELKAQVKQLLKK